MGISVRLGQQENDADQASVAEVWVPLSLPGTVYKAIGEKHFHWTYRKDKDLGCEEISKTSILPVSPCLASECFDRGGNPLGSLS